jgi:histone-lysine N-methyltransferase SETMAR
MEFTRPDIHLLQYYCWKRGLTPSETCAEVNATLDHGTVSLRTCQRTSAKFRSGNFDFDKREQAGRPPFDIDEEIQQCLNEDKRATTRTIALSLNCSHETVRKHLINMGKKYLENAWVPHNLTETNKANRVRICEQLLQMFHQNDFLSQLITCDEIWIYWDNVGTFNNKSWRSQEENPIGTVTRRLTSRKHLASVFWDSKGLLLMDVLPRNVTIKADTYCAQLDRLVLALKEKRRRQCQGGFHNIHLLHDNATPHTAAVTKMKLQTLGLSVLPHPPYSPDLSPSDYYLFSPLKSSLRGKTFDSSEEINTAIMGWFDSKPRDFFMKGICSLPVRWRKCVEYQGTYFSHLHDVDG